MIIIPDRKTKRITQANRSKILSDLWASFNLDLQSNLGVIRVSPKLLLNTGGVTNQGLSVAFSAFDFLIFTIAGTRVFKNSDYTLTSAFVEDASGGNLINDYSADYSDMLTFNNTLVVTSASKLATKAGDTSGTGNWTTRANITNNSHHKLCYFVKFNRVYFIDAFHEIHSMDSSWSVATSGDYTIVIDYKLGSVRTMVADSTDMWIGLDNPIPSVYTDAVQGSSIVRWDGISNQITAQYPIKAKGVLALCKDDRNIVHAIDTNGALLQFTGSGFEEIARLPLNRSLLTKAQTQEQTNDSFVHPNGFYFTRNGTFIVLVNNLVGDSSSSIKENLPSGIWEYHKDTGFVHRQSISYTPMGSTTITDHGQNRISRVGALYEPNIYSESANGRSMIICGATYYTDASNTASGIFIDDPLDTTQKYGYFVTRWMLSDNLTDIWQKLALKYRQLLSSTDKIVLKFRKTEASPTDISGTWSAITPTASTFTTTTNLQAFVGYEVEVVQGTGSGKCSHITNVTVNGGTYTVTVDESYVGGTGTFKARIQNWTKCATISDQISESIMKNIPNATCMRIQVKVCAQFTGENEIFELGVVNKGHELLA